VRVHADDLGQAIDYVYTPELQLSLRHNEADTTEIAWFNGHAVAQISHQSSTARFTFTDHLGTPSLQTDSTAQIVWQADYEPFGRIYQLRAGGSEAEQPLRLPGQEIAADNSIAAGEYYNVFRWYQSGWGRYTQADPLADELTLPLVGLNLYVYGDDNPIDIIDPEGLSGSKPGGPYHPPDGVQTKCEPGDTCQQIRNKMWVLRRMIDSHTGWDRTMPRPRGGNRHSQEIEQLWKQYARCQELEPEACKEEKCDVCKKVAVGVAAVGTGYIIYRCVRMIPSLFPPLWPTIPLNAAAP